VVKATSVHPRVATGEDVVESLRIWRASICPSEAAVEGEGEPRKSRRGFRRAGSSKGRAAKPLSIVETGKKKLPRRRGGHRCFRARKEAVGEGLLGIVHAHIGTNLHLSASCAASRRTCRPGRVAL